MTNTETTFELFVNEPIEEIRDGALRATIWRNTNVDDSLWYSTDLNRRYRNSSGEWEYAPDFRGIDLLKIAILAQRAYGRVQELRISDKKAIRAGAKTVTRR